MADKQIEPATLNIDEKEIDKHMKELNSVKTEEELDTKLSGLSKQGFSISSWMKYLFNRESETEEFNPVWLSIDEYKAQAEISLQNAFKVLHLPNWKLEKKGSTRGDIVESTNTDQFGKVYKFTGLVDCPPEFLFKEFRDNIAKLPEWNPAVLKSEVIKEIAPGIDLSYQVTAGGGKGIIAPRDFTILRRGAALSAEGTIVETSPYCYVSSGVSVQVPGYPPVPGMVRGNNKVGGWCLKPVVVDTPAGKQTKTKFQWLMCCDLKGKIPQFVLDTAFSTAMLDYIVHVRKFVADSKTKGLIQ